MDIGRQGDIRDVDRLGEFQLGVKGAAGGQGVVAILEGAQS